MGTVDKDGNEQIAPKVAWAETYPSLLRGLWQNPGIKWETVFGKVATGWSENAMQPCDFFVWL